MEKKSPLCRDFIRLALHAFYLLEHPGEASWRTRAFGYAPAGGGPPRRLWMRRAT